MSRSLGSTPLTIRPSIATVPALIVSSPATMRRRVDLPQPDGPTTTTSSPSATAQLTPCTTSRVPYDFRTPSRVTVAIRTARSRFWKIAIPAQAGIHWPAYRVVVAWIPACAGMAHQMTQSRARLPAQVLLAARRSGLAEAEFFEAGGHAQPIVRWHDDGHRHQPRLHLRDQGAEDAAAAMLGSDAGITQVEDFVLGIMPLQHLGIDEHEADDALLSVERDPGFAHPPAVANERIERLLALQRVDE